ncbi:endolytic transglycosylase MltG [Sutterella sp.]|uniref:endolytic transglycosylase MltG n=1 Tax=Sutterella sp. TaxID=1981025 RepID=UPI0026E07A93|nr:endolytic transglycosylase MltG [Sutterella sp.]MDO5532693.1 endolytic transglycosylase MltG [Sutterella sp.]
MTRQNESTEGKDCPPEMKDEAAAPAAPETQPSPADSAPSGTAPGNDAGAGTAPAESSEPVTEAPAPVAQPEEPEAEKPVKRRGLSPAAKILTALLALVLLAGAVAYGTWKHVEGMLYSEPAPMDYDIVEIQVTEGQSASDALASLRAAGVTLPPWQVRVLRRFEPSLLTRIHVGRFRFERGMTPEQVLKTLSGPALIDQQVRIPEGVPVWEALSILENAEGLNPDSLKMESEELLKSLGLGEYKSLEGFLAPETYRYGSGSSNLSVIRLAVARQQKLLEEAWSTRNALCRVKSPYELLILASIIEKETGVKSDRHLVSSVFNNRLRIGMPLQTDPTVIYGLGEGWNGRLRRKELDTPTPWNTYTFAGLPPTPISMPSAASIEAAAHPAESKYLYFVARGDGTSEFSTNLRDHNRAVKHFIIDKRTDPLRKTSRPAKQRQTEQQKANGQAK